MNRVADRLFICTLPQNESNRIMDYAYINGVPRKIVLDNLKAGIVKACR